MNPLLHRRRGSCVISVVGRLTGAAMLAALAAGLSASAWSADTSLILPEVTVTAPPVTPEWKKWNPYGGSIRVEEDKWPDIPCSASRIAAGAATGCKTGPLLSYAGVGLPMKCSTPRRSHYTMGPQLVPDNP